MSGRSRPATLARAGVLLAVAALLCGCVSMPVSGPVTEAAGTGVRDADVPAVAIDPEGPVADARPEEIVRGFLDAMQAYPIETATAREFLTAEARATWRPDGVTTYAVAEAPEGFAAVDVTLSGADRVSGRGFWLGPVPPDQRTLTFRMVQDEDGQYRIADPPDSLVVPETWFEERFQQAAIYFFDPSGQILVPEPVYVPTDQTFASTLVEALLGGPHSSRVARTYLPGGLELALSAPVSAEGVVDIALEGGDLAPPPAEDTEEVLAQLAWTLRQDPRISGFRVTIAGEPLRTADGSEVVSVDQGASVDPTGPASSPLLYALRGQRLVSGTIEGLAVVDGPFGQQRLGVRSVAVNLAGTRVVGVSGGGGSLQRGPVADPDGSADVVLSEADDLLDPVWDFRDRVWLVDRNGGEAVVRMLAGDTARPVTVPGISGRVVTRFLVSRDASRLVAVVRGPDGDTLRISRLQYADDGRLEGATPSRAIPVEDDLDGAIVDIAWHTPTTIAVLTRTSPSGGRVTTVGVDGAPTTGDAVVATTVRDPVGLVGSPEVDQVLYAVLRAGDGALRNLVDLSGGITTPRAVGPLSDVGYVG